MLQAADFATTVPTSTPPYVPLYHALVKASRIDATAAPVGGTMQGLLGAVSTTIAGITPHAWQADASGQFHPVDSAGRIVDLAPEWQGYAALMLAGKGAGLTAVQRLEGNAETIFQHTAIAALDPRLQSIYREDAQREFDALGAALTLDFQRYGIDPRAPFTPQTYLTLERTIQSDATLLELAVQGHGLNSPPAARYRGYTNDFQHNVDATTRYVGPGLNRGHNALTDLFDDNVISHVCFPTVWHDGSLVLLNQNANLEDTLDEAVDALNYSAFSGVYTWQDFAGSRVSGTLADTAGTRSSRSPGSMRISTGICRTPPCSTRPPRRRQATEPAAGNSCLPWLPDTRLGQCVRRHRQAAARAVCSSLAHAVGRSSARPCRRISAQSSAVGLAIVPNT